MLNRLLLILVSAFLFSMHSNAQESKWIWAEEAYILIHSNPDVLIIDARDKKDFDALHIKGATCAPNSKELFRLVKNRDKDLPILIYCNDGNRSNMAAQLLLQKEFKNIFVLINGFNFWLNEGYETNKL